jgi:hypothetical protein
MGIEAPLEGSPWTRVGSWFLAHYRIVAFSALAFLGSGVVVFFLPDLPTADTNLITAYQNVAAVRARMHIRDANAKVENVIFHPMAGDGANEVRECHHDHNDCYEGKKIKPQHRVNGPSKYRLCDVCAKMA